MLVSCRTSRILLEAAEREGIDPRAILEPLGLEHASLVDRSRSISWDVMTRIFEQLAALLEHDPARIQAVGRSMTYVPAYAVLRGIAATTISVKTLYRLTERWVATANFPHLAILLTFTSGDRVVINVTIPEPHAPSEAFCQLTIGAMSEVPALLGLPASDVLEARVTPRSLDLVLGLPRRRSLLGGAARAVLAAARRRTRLDVLEEQRRMLVEGLASVQHARDELRTLLEGLPDLVLIHVDGIVSFANRAAVKALGWSASTELVGRAITTLLDERSLAHFRAHEARGSDAELARVWFRTRAGRALLVELAATQPVVFEDTPSRLVVGRDLAEREKLQQQLAAADRLASVGLLAAGVAHEINNPLAYVLNNIEVARRQLGKLPDAPPETAEALSTALEGVDRIRFIVRELLSLARGDEGRLVPTDVQAVVDSALALSRIEIERVARLVVDFQPVPPVLATVPRLAQIVLSLVRNAVDAMAKRPSGRGELTVRVAPAGSSQVTLEIADNGVGVPDDAKGRVFDPFYTTKPSGAGTGLGLTVTQRVVLELGGEVTFTSTPAGTTFRVILPAAE
jgi:PAS domain S-box-containing protein